MKKLLCLLLVVCMCLSVFAACGSEDDYYDDDYEAYGDGESGETTEATTEAAPALSVQQVTLTTLGETAEIYAGPVDPKTVYWYSEDSSIAAVDAGVVVAQGSGTTTVHGLFGDLDLTCSVTCNVSYGSSKKPIMAAPAYENVDSSFFDDAVFVGDSISLKLSYDESGELGDAQFLVQGSYGVGNAIFDVLKTDYRGETYEDLEDAIAATGAKKLFIMMGMNDIALYGIDETIKNWGTMLELIREACPGIQIYIQSMTPIWTGGEIGGLNNPNINTYNAKLRKFAMENDCGFIDVAPYMRDATGGLATEFCSDNYVHLTDAGVAVWIKVLKAQVY